MFSYWNPGPSNHYEKPMQTLVTEDMYVLVKTYSSKHNVSMAEYIRNALKHELIREMFMESIDKESVTMDNNQFDGSKDLEKELPPWPPAELRNFLYEDPIIRRINKKIKEKYPDEYREVMASIDKENERNKEYLERLNKRINDECVDGDKVDYQKLQDILDEVLDRSH